STNMAGYPIVGDFDGDGLDDLGSFTQDRFYLDLSSEGPGNTIGIPGQISGQADRIFRFGFPGPRDRPVAADMDGDGIDDIGLWVPDRGGATPFEGAEWYFLISADRSIVERIVDHPDLPGEFTVEFTPDPFGDDLFLKFGDDFAQPVIGNFDPPVTPLLAGGLPEPAVVDVYDGRFHNASNPHDVNLSGDVSLGDALVVVSELRRNGVQP